MLSAGRSLLERLEVEELERERDMVVLGSDEVDESVGEL